MRVKFGMRIPLTCRFGEDSVERMIRFLLEWIEENHGDKAPYIRTLVQEMDIFFFLYWKLRKRNCLKASWTHRNCVESIIRLLRSPCLAQLVRNA